MRLTLALLHRHWSLRRRPLYWNNFWQLTRVRKIKNKRIAEGLQQSGIAVTDLEDAANLTPFLPRIPQEMVDAAEAAGERDPIKGPIEYEEAHPFYKERPAYSFLQNSDYPKGYQLDHAKNLTKTVELSAGLPERVVSATPTEPLLPDQDELISDVIKECVMADSTQRRLPKNPAVPYIGWHPVNDRMNTTMAYDVTKISWQRGVRRTYGIPAKRKNENLMRGLLRYCDVLSADNPGLLRRNHLENITGRQFYERLGRLVRIYLDVDFALADPKPLEAFAGKEVVAKTSETPLPDISPMNALTAVWPAHVYRRENNFPVRDRDVNSAPNVVMAVGMDNLQHPWCGHDYFSARALTQCFLLAVGQARLNYGPDVAGTLPDPIAMTHVFTNGRQFYFSAFQLNTMDFGDDEGVKNLFWQDEEIHDLYEVCEYVRARPNFEGYNPQVFRKLQGLYLQHSL